MTAETAARLGMETEFWLTLQAHYELALMCERRPRIWLRSTLGRIRRNPENKAGAIKGSVPLSPQDIGTEMDFRTLFSSLNGRSQDQRSPRDSLIVLVIGLVR